MEVFGLVLLMAAVTYPSRAMPMLAPGIERLPAKALLYLRLVGPAVLASLAAANTFVRETPQGTQEFYIGIEAVGVVACLAIVVWRRNLLLGLLVGVGVVALVGPSASGCAASRAFSPCARRPRSPPAGSGRSAAATTTSVAAGRMSREDLAVDRDDRVGVRGSTMNIRVRTTSSSAEAGLGERPLDDRERRACLGGGVAGMPRRAGRDRRPSSR